MTVSVCYERVTALNVLNVEWSAGIYAKTAQLKRHENASGQWDVSKLYAERVECANRILSR
jgi:hypothetical protein